MPYKRRPSPLRTLWTYRHLFATAFVVGVLLWFILINNEKVTVSFPFGLGKIESSGGILILMSALVGALASGLGLGVFMTVRRLKSRTSDAEVEEKVVLPDDRPPADYAAKSSEGFDHAPWSARPERRDE
jgi:uncharacterized integral membrane protein